MATAPLVHHLLVEDLNPMLLEDRYRPEVVVDLHYHFGEGRGVLRSVEEMEMLIEGHGHHLHHEETTVGRTHTEGRQEMCEMSHALLLAHLDR